MSKIVSAQRIDDAQAALAAAAAQTRANDCKAEIQPIQGIIDEFLGSPDVLEEHSEIEGEEKDGIPSNLFGIIVVFMYLCVKCALCTMYTILGRKTLKIINILDSRFNFETLITYTC